MSHTPGPWKVGTAREMHQQLATGGIAILAHSQRYDAECALFNMPHNETFGGADVTVANARLIAAAPDLLQALEAYVALTIDDTLRTTNEGRPALMEALAAANAATAKAKP